MEGDIDFCEAFAGLDDPAIEKVAAMFGMPKTCPVPKVRLKKVRQIN